ncbi:MAG: Rieske 2Fe-2S domain-containing protein [Thermodesulfobacteriota bacterium]|nr:Rieske 2Fe-2S domain-containing protein [Thermodesulfobacteriota bacterium]
MDTTSQSDKKFISRRKLIGYAWIGAAAVVAGELVVGTFAFLWPRRKGGKGEKVFIAGKVNDFKAGEVIYFRKEKTFIQRSEMGFLAFSAVCPHLACIVNWNEMLKKFECPCHGAKFNPNGEVLEGPPPRPLDLYKLQIVEEKLVIDTAGLIERKKFEPSQVVKG